MLTDQLDHQGKWLFRWRSYLPLILAPLILSAMLGFSYPLGSHGLDILREYACLGLALLGLGLRVAAVGFVSGGTSGRSTRRMNASELNTTGMYSMVRHPLYLANYVIFVAVLLNIGQWWLVLCGSLIYWLYYERIMVAEEAFLRATHGEAFERWAAKTPAILPHPHLWAPPRLRFSWRATLRREYTTLFLIIALFTAVELVGHTLIHGHLELEDGWGPIFLAGLVIYLACWMAKKSRLLAEPNR